MDRKFVVHDVSMEAVMHIARTVNVSTKSLSKESLAISLQGICGSSYLQRGLIMAEQLDMIRLVEGKLYEGTDEFRNDFHKLAISDFQSIARKALQGYTPFLSFISNLLAGYDVAKAARIMSGTFEINPEAATKFFRNSGIYAGILVDTITGKVVLESSISQDPDYIKNLKASLTSEIEATNLIISLLSADVFNYFAKNGIDFKRPAKALIEIQKDPKTSLYKIFEFIELCLFGLGKDRGVNVQMTQGIGQMIQSFRSSNLLLSNPTNVGVGLGSMRNMANHGPDKETGKPWMFTEEAALGTALLSFRYLRSVYLHIDSGTQVL